MKDKYTKSGQKIAVCIAMCIAECMKMVADLTPRIGTVETHHF